MSRSWERSRHVEVIGEFLYALYATTSPSCWDLRSEKFEKPWKNCLKVFKSLEESLRHSADTSSKNKIKRTPRPSPSPRVICLSHRIWTPFCFSSACFVLSCSFHSFHLLANAKSLPESWGVNLAHLKDSNHSEMIKSNVSYYIYIYIYINWKLSAKKTEWRKLEKVPVTANAVNAVRTCSSCDSSSAESPRRCCRDSWSDCTLEGGCTMLHSHRHSKGNHAIYIYIS